MDPSPIQYEDLYDYDARYIIPKFQRDYNWKLDHIDEFWNDLIEQWNNWKEKKKKKERTPYYFGSMMLVNKDKADSTYLVVDGQQRMTTSMIFFIALRDYFLECGNRNDVEYFNRIIYYENEEEQLEPRLELNRYNNPYFKEKIIEEKEITAKKLSIGTGYRVKDRELANCYKQIATKLVDFKIESEDKSDQLRDLGEHLLRNFYVVRNIFETKQLAYRIFETINHKGLHLDENDLVKNYLMELIDDTGSVEESQDVIDADDKWECIMSKLESVKIKEDFFLRTHLTAFVGKTPKDKIYENILKKIKTKTQTQSFLNDLEKSTEFLFKIKNAEDRDWNSDQEIIDNLNGLNALTDGGMYPILLAAYEKLKPNEMKKLIELVTKLHFRAKTVCGLSYTSIEGLVVKICDGLANQNYSISDIQKEVISWPQYPTDDEFEVKFNQLELSSSAKARYVLTEIEYSKTGGRSTASTHIVQDIQVEHIMPKSIDGDWHDELKTRPGLETPTKIDDYKKRNLNRLGNLTLLSSNANAIIQNDGYQKKLNGDRKYSGYRNDRLEITSSLVKYNQWNEEVMKAREADFYVHAKKIWDLKLCSM